MTRPANLDPAQCYSHSAAWVGLGPEIGNDFWIQTGYLRYRYANESNVTFKRYLEIKRPNQDPVFIAADPPQDGTVHAYSVIFDYATGKVQAMYDGDVWAERTYSALIGKEFRSAQFEGEINNVKAKIPGTTAARCTFSDCATMELYGSYQSTSFALPLMNTLPAEFGTDLISPTSFEIWAKNPV